MLSVIAPQKEIVDKKPFWEVRFMATSEAREAGASEHPGQSRANGTTKFFLCSLLSYQKKKKKSRICIVSFRKAIKESIYSLKAYSILMKHVNSWRR